MNVSTVLNLCQYENQLENKHSQLLLTKNNCRQYYYTTFMCMCANFTMCRKVEKEFNVFNHMHEIKQVELEKQKLNQCSMFQQKPSIFVHPCMILNLLVAIVFLKVWEQTCTQTDSMITVTLQIKTDNYILGQYVC